MLLPNSPESQLPAPGYHNYAHALSHAQSMYWILRKTPGVFTELERLHLDAFWLSKSSWFDPGMYGLHIVFIGLHILIVTWPRTPYIHTYA
ncbi:hypothetical protein CEXT_761391 [Caerostris extrusa]|uniref:Uncharacterized protein n=1 Tax=Caerostris extrusa TaxID=172846 RepID=A0AAV4T8P8_CAEEX|nr:hypothetical protein CEXT_761391 [Caerostris extrusa]